MINKAPHQDDDLWAMQLEACDEAIRSGELPETVGNAPGITDVDPSLREVVDVLRMLDRAYRPENVGSAQGHSIPSKIGRFRIERTLGHGGFGTVFLATDPLLQRKVAIKVPAAPSFVEPTQRQRFLREAQAAAALSHPNLIPVFEAGESHGFLYLTAEYTEGPTLAEWLRSQSEDVGANNSDVSGMALATGEAVQLQIKTPVTSAIPLTGYPGRLSPQQAVEIVRQLAGAVEYAHRHGILHRDIKPRNVILDQRRPGPRLAFTPRLTDFGLAKMMEASSDQSTLSGAILGTPEYMAPEQAAGETSKIGPATDVYGLGVLLYELLTGQTPFRGESPAKTLRLVLNQSLTSPSSLNSQVPQCLDTACLRCLQRDPKLRYASPGELAAELQLFLDDDGDSISRERRSNLSTILQRPYWRRIVSGIALALLGFAALFGIWSYSGPGREKLVIDEPTTNKAPVQPLPIDSASFYPLQNGAIVSLRNLHTQWYLNHGGLDGNNTKELVVATLQCDTGVRWKVMVEQPGVVRLQNVETHLYLESLPPFNKNEATKWWPADSFRFTTAADLRPQGIWQVIEKGRGAFCFKNLTHGSYLDVRDGESEAELREMFGQPFETQGSYWSIKLLETGAGPIWMHLDGHAPHETWSLAFSPDGKTLASAGDDFHVRLWDVATGKPKTVLRGHEKLVTAVAFAPNGKILASASYDGTIKLWDAQAESLLATHPTAEQKLRCLAFSPDGGVLAAGTKATTGPAEVRLWETRTWREIPSLGGHPKTVRSICFSIDGRALVSACEDGGLRWWDTKTWQLGGQSDEMDDASCLAMAPDGQALASANKVGGIHLWDVVNRREKSLLRGHTGEVFALTFSPDSTTLCSASDDKSVRLWEVATGRERLRLEAHNTRANAVAFAPDGRTLASASHDGVIKVWYNIPAQ